MEDRCPKCNGSLITKTIKKELGLDSIDYPVIQVCPKCNWTRDLTGAGDIGSTTVGFDDEISHIADSLPRAQQKPYSPGKLLVLALAILVLGGIVWAGYYYYSVTSEHPASTPAPAPVPDITGIPQASVITDMPVPEATPTGEKVPVKLDRKRGFFSLPQGIYKIKPGDEVVWTNEGIDPLTLVSSDGLFEARLLDNDKRTNYTFKKPGTYNFYLKENESLTGTIIVET
ncbi:hypothetical protein ANME2D_00052 [Candidatus Methanoperedens nitroreducens]|uniref:Plastocyanin n=1 Tax=Candidatus Methanoperedens nitratireducens TaxID=1392998 RepID=A0A062V8Z8_9EURY|nr:hypothetical protein [Candidatus Methanoperedens nitroreducens]KCZ72993.1 hypothetical protein ANME2D_00052 [Candidatus Methanoperedens nitroreducens]MDJ1423063.1 hypothetical protein [Candidatus Methanoperedens sp.]